MGNARRIWKALGAASLLAVSLVVLVPALTGHPLVSYASSGSMEPTIGVFDAFFVNPWPGALEPGDIIVFDSVTQGGPAVHRIVGGDERGWITKGDANAGADQFAGEPPVTRERILGKVLVRGDGAPILLDDGGLTFVEARNDLTRLAMHVGGPRQATALALLLLALVFAVPAFGRKKPEPPVRLPLRIQRGLRRAFPRGILGRHLGILLLVGLLASFGWAAVQARTELPISLIVVEEPTAADDSRAAAPGGALTRDIRIGSLGILPTTILVEGGTDRVRVDPDRAVATAGPMSTTLVNVQEVAGDEVGLQDDVVHLWRYPSFLPPATLASMHAALPGSPYLVLAALVSGAGYAWYASLRISRVPIGRMLGIREGWL